MRILAYIVAVILFLMAGYLLDIFFDVGYLIISLLKQVLPYYSDTISLDYLKETIRIALILIGVSIALYFIHYLISIVQVIKRVRGVVG